MLERVKNIFGCDMRSLAIFRVALAFLLLYDVLDRFPHSQAFYSDAGFFSTEYSKEESPACFSLNYLSGSVVFQQFLFVMLGVSAVALALGCLTRLATVVCWILLVSVHVRNPFVLIGGDTLLRLMLFWSMFIPLSSTWSVDAWLRRRKKHKSGCPRSNWVWTAGTGCLLMQVCLMYWCAGASKLTETWIDGTAMEYILRLDLYVRPFGEWALTQPLLLKSIAYGTLLVELAVPFLLFVPVFTPWFRLAVILAFWSLHLGIELAMDVGNFGAVSMVAWLPFLPSFIWNKLLPDSRIAKAASDSGKTVERSLAIRVLGWMTSAVPILLLIYIVFWNLAGMYNLSEKWRPRFSEEFYRLGWVTMVAQNFQMFGDPPRYNPCFVFNGRLKDGVEMDLVRHQPASQSRPDQLDRKGVSAEWKKIHRFLLRHPGNARFHQSLLDYYVRQWNEKNSPEQAVVEAKVECYYQQTGPGFKEGNFVRRPDLAQWSMPRSEEATEEELIDDVNSFFKGLDQGPINMDQ